MIKRSPQRKPPIVCEITRKFKGRKLRHHPHVSSPRLRLLDFLVSGRLNNLIPEVQE